MDKLSLGMRMKQYESAVDFAMIRRVPIVVRVDGKNFSNPKVYFFKIIN